MASITKQLDHWQLDAQEADTGAVDVTGGVLNANAATQYIGLEFVDASFADLKGTTITNAYLELYYTSGSSGSPDVTIYGHDADYSSAFLGATYEISGMAQTTAGVTWSASNIGTGWKTSPDIKTVIQEIIDRAGWWMWMWMWSLSVGGGRDEIRDTRYEIRVGEGIGDGDWVE